MAALAEGDLNMQAARLERAVGLDLTGAAADADAARNLP